MAWPKILRPKKSIKEFLRANIDDFDLNDPDTRKLYQEALKDERARIEDIAKTEFINTRPGMKSPFPKWDASHPEQYSRPITVFDTETGHNNEIVAIGAVKVALNNVTKKFETVDTYERYYMPTETRSKQWREALAVHGLTPDLLNKLRKQQHAGYGKHYDAQEEIAFRKFFEGSILSGHNIDKADIPWALGDYLPHTSTIDTLTAMENIRGVGGNKLDQVFRDVTGKTMAQAGFGHHNALADTYATAVILEALLGQKNLTGQSLRYILNSDKIRHLVPKDTPDVYGESQVAWGPYKGYLKGVEYYMSRENLPMKPLDECYDIMDPETGKFKPGWKIEDFGMSRVDTEVDQVMRSLAMQIRDTQKILSRSLRDLSGSLRISSASARPGKLRFLSKFVGEGPVYKTDAPQAWKDAARVLGIPSNDLGKYYKSSYDYAVTQGKLTEEQQLSMSRQKGYAMADKAYNEGRITKGQLKRVIAADNVAQALDEAVENTDAWTAALKKFSDIPVFNPDRLFSAFEGGMQHALGQMKGILPSYMTSPLRRYADLVSQNNRYNYAPFKAADNIMNAVVPSAGAIGEALGGPMGEGIGMGVAGLFKAGTQIWGNVKEAQISRQWNMTSMGLDILGISVDLITMPFKALAKTTGLLTRSFGLLSRQIGGMSQLGTPLTNLTGIGYSQYQGYEIAEGMIGLGRGTLNSLSEDFARQSQLLYTRGQVNTDRLVASSMLGVFNEVYGPQASMEKTVNALVAAGRTDATSMALVSQISPQLAQVLQVMSDLGVKQLSDLSNPTRLRGVYFNNLSDRERRNMRVDAYEYSAIAGSIGNSFKRIGDLVWRGGGKTLADSINRVIAGIAESSDWREAWGKIKDTFSDIGDSSFIANIKDGLGSIWESIKPKLLKGIDWFANTWLDVIGRMLEGMVGPVTEFLNYLRNFKVDYKIGKGFIIEQRYDPKKDKLKGIQWSMADARWPDALGKVLNPLQGTGEEVYSQALKQKEFAEKHGGLFQLYDEDGIPLSWTDFTKMAKQYGNDYIRPDYVGNTFHSAVETAKAATHKAIELAPETIENLTESIDNAISAVQQEVKTVVEVHLIDSKGQVKVANGVGTKAVGDNAWATIISMQNKKAK